MEIVSKALKESLNEQKEFYATALSTLKAELTKVKNRIDGMYIDRLDGKISEEDYSRRYEDFRARQAELIADIERHQRADDNALTDGLMLFKLAQNALGLFQKQPPSERRRLLQVLTQKCEVKDGQLSIVLKEPFEKLRVTNAEWEKMKANGNEPVLTHCGWYTFINDVRGLLHGPIGQWDKFLHGVRFFATAA